jgi:hypothetical protein
VHLQWVARPPGETGLWWAAGRDTTRFHRLLAERTDLRARLDLALGQATAGMWEMDLCTGVLSSEPQALEVLTGVLRVCGPGVPVPAGALPGPWGQRLMPMVARRVRVARPLTSQRST